MSRIRRALRFNPKGRLKDWQRRRLLARHGVGVECSTESYSAGARSGTWTVVTEGLDRDSVVYSFGVGDNLAWELALIRRWGLTVHAFDPTPRSIEWVRDQPLPSELIHVPLGLADHDGVQAFALPRSSKSVNYRPASSGETIDRAVTCPVRRLETLRREFGHDRIDVLKMDIEGGEYDVIEDVVAESPHQVLIEFHHRADGTGFDRTLTSLHRLRDCGYRIHWISRRGLEFGFVRTDHRP